MQRPPILENGKLSRYVIGVVFGNDRDIKGVILVDDEKNLHIQFFVEGFPTIIKKQNNELIMGYEMSEPYEVLFRKKEMKRLWLK